MSRESILVAGAWRNGIEGQTKDIVESYEAHQKSGFHLLPDGQTIINLANLLDGYDDYVQLSDEETPSAVVDGEFRILDADELRAKYLDMGFAGEPPGLQYAATIGPEPDPAKRNLMVAPQPPPPPKPKAKVVPMSKRLK